MMYKKIFGDVDELLTMLNEKKMNTKHHVKKDGKNYFIHVPAIGFKKEDLDIQFEDDLLTISGKVGENVPDFIKDKEIHIQYEIQDFVVDDVKAKLENGLLTVEILAKKSDDSLNKKVLID